MMVEFSLSDCGSARSTYFSGSAAFVLVNVPAGVELAAAWANQPDFKVELVTVAPRTHYRVKVTPPEGAKPQQAVILLRSVGAVPAGAGLTFYARVK